jgi:signal transduction histidine kinase
LIFFAAAIIKPRDFVLMLLQNVEMASATSNETLEEAHSTLRKIARNCQQKARQVTFKLRHHSSEMSAEAVAASEAELRTATRVLGYAAYSLSNLPEEPEEQLRHLRARLREIEILSA